MILWGREGRNTASDSAHSRMNLSAISRKWRISAFYFFLRAHASRTPLGLPLLNIPVGQKMVPEFLLKMQC